MIKSKIITYKVFVIKDYVFGCKLSIHPTQDAATVNLSMLLPLLVNYNFKKLKNKRGLKNMRFLTNNSADFFGFFFATARRPSHVYHTERPFLFITRCLAVTQSVARFLCDSWLTCRCLCSVAENTAAGEITRRVLAFITAPPRGTCSCRATRNCRSILAVYERPRKCDTGFLNLRPHRRSTQPQTSLAGVAN